MPDSNRSENRDSIEPTAAAAARASTREENLLLIPDMHEQSTKKMGEEHDNGEDDVAISFRNAYKHYGRRYKKVPVLIGMDMTIPRGAIYGLLGPSGCGKTTLLQCIVGKKSLKSGDVTVFGGTPGTPESGVPGARVGYMPQELALYGEFTIPETLQYFGRIFGMSKEDVKKRTEFLIEFLDLPKGKRLIMNLSGGQQRRASLAAALLHEPELLILDEPTVGVDPLLRQCIWTHLLEISRSSRLQTTIVVTTHYIEEARQANVVGMMRFGRLLAEGHPDQLLEKYERSTLEDVFLHLCLGDETERMDEKTRLEEVEGDDMVDVVEKGRREVVKNDKTAESNAMPMSELSVTVVGQKKKEEKKKSSSSSCCIDNSFFSCHRLAALLIKSFIRMWRNIGFLIFQFIIPTVQVALFCLAIGRDPTGMTVSVFNQDISTVSCEAHTFGCIFGNRSDFFEDDFDFTDADRANLSCRYLSYIDPVVIEPIFYDSLEGATQDAKRGKRWGVVHFKENYTEALVQRLLPILFRPNADMLDRSDIHVALDMTNQQIGYTIQLRLVEAYQRFAEDLLSSCDLEPKLASVPIVFEQPIYGSGDPTFTEFMAPGVILSITFFMAVGLTALSFIIERKEGLLDRSWVAGVTATEVMLAHVMTQFVVMSVQVALVLTFMIEVFNVPAEGPVVWIVTLTLLQGVCGMAFGLVISALCDNEQDAIQVALGSFYPNLLLSGIMWPLEGMPEALRYISYTLPQTFACEAMRGILSRGWGLDWMQVYRGYLVTIAWTVVLLVMSAVILRIRR